MSTPPVPRRHCRRADVKVGLALLPYLLRRLRLDDFEGEKRPARGQHVVPSDPDEK